MLPKTIGRLVGMFPAEEQQSARLRLADNLMGVVSQRLLPRRSPRRLERQIGLNRVAAIQNQHLPRQPQRRLVRRLRPREAMQRFPYRSVEILARQGSRAAA